MIAQNVNISTNKSVLGDSQLASYKQLIVTSYYCYCPQIKDECPILVMKLSQRNKNAIRTKKGLSAISCSLPRGANSCCWGLRQWTGGPLGSWLYCTGWVCCCIGWWCEGSGRGTCVCTAVGWRYWESGYGWLKKFSVLCNTSWIGRRNHCSL